MNSPAIVPHMKDYHCQCCTEHKNIDALVMPLKNSVCSSCYCYRSTKLDVVNFA